MCIAPPRPPPQRQHRARWTCARVWTQVAVEASASQLIALPFGGVLVLSEHSVACHSGGAVRAHQVSASGVPTIFRAHGRVDPDGTRWLLSDAAGTLYVLAIGLTDRAEVTSLTLQRLGQTVAASAICYLDNGVVYLGSSCADAVAALARAARTSPDR